MHTGHDQERHKGTDDGGQCPGADLFDGQQDADQTVTDDAAQRSQHTQGNGSHDEDSQHRPQDEFDHRGHDFIDKALHIGQHQCDEENGDDRGRVGDHPDRQTQHMDNVGIGFQCNVIGV